MSVTFYEGIFNFVTHSNMQIHEEAKKFSYQTGVKVVVAYGGAPISQQVITVLLVISFYGNIFYFD